MANKGCKDQKNSQYCSFIELPREMKGIVNMDKSGIPNLRCKKF